jgi:hypothetical protein
LSPGDPSSIIVGIAALIVLYAIGRDGKWKRWFSRHRGKCPKCGYNLEFDFERGCPECGWRRDALQDSKQHFQ